MSRSIDENSEKELREKKYHRRYIGKKYNVVIIIIMISITS